MGILDSIKSKLNFTSKSSPTFNNINEASINANLQDALFNINSINGFGNSFNFYNNQFQANALTNHQDIARIINTCPPVNYILQRKAIAFANGKLNITNSQGKDILNSFKYTRLLKYPNFLNTEIQFRIQVNFITKAFGYCPILKVRSVGFDEITSIWALPPTYFDIKFNGKLFNQASFIDAIDTIYLNVNGGERKLLNKDDVFIFTDLTPYIHNQYLPQSILTSLSMPILNIEKNYEARANLMANRGAVGAWVNNGNDGVADVPLLPDDKKELLKDFQESYGLNKNQFNQIISLKNIRWENASYPIKDLMMTEQEEHDIKTICDTIGYPYPLLSRGSETTFNNANTANRTLYQDYVIPDSENYDQQLMVMLNCKTNSVNINYDYSHLSVLQIDAKYKAEAFDKTVNATVKLFIANGCTYKNYLIENNQDYTQANVDLLPLFFYQMPQEFKDSFLKMPTSNNNSQSNNNNNDGTTNN